MDSIVWGSSNLDHQSIDFQWTPYLWEHLFIEQ